MFNILSLIFRYFFILIIYMFILAILRLIYLDIKKMNQVMGDEPYLKLINRKESLSFPMKEVYTLNENMTIGRRRESDIVIPDPYVSNEHLKIFKEEQEYYIEDLDSANGTYLNKDRIVNRMQLKSGDRIKIGQVAFLYVKSDK